MTHITILGATGLIGTALIKELAAHEYSVTAACRDVPKAKGRLPAYVNCIALDFDSTTWRENLPQSDAVINLSGAPVIGRLTPQHRQTITSSRVGVTKNLIASIEKYCPELPLLINASAIGVYGSHTLTDDIYTERDAPQPEDYLSHLCRDWEAATTSHAITRTILLRTGLVLDPSTHGTLAKLVLPFRLFAGGTIGIKDSWRSWIHIDDEIGLILYALEHPTLSGPLNMCAPNPITASEFAKALSAALNRPNWLPVPEWVVRLALGEAAEIITRGKRVLPDKAISADFQFKFPIINQALEHLMS